MGKLRFKGGVFIFIETSLTIIFGKTDTQVDFLDLLLEKIFLVEEKHNGSGGEEPVVADTVEEMETLMHAVLGETWEIRRRYKLKCTGKA